VNEAVVRMLATIAVLFVAMKVLVTVQWHVRTASHLRLHRFLAFAIWPGMDLGPFAETDTARTNRACGDAWPLVFSGMTSAAAGLGLLAAARALYPSPAASALALVGLSLVLHFGIFSLLGALLRARGIGVRPVFDAPFRSRSLGEFWGRRWNRGFSEMTAALVHRPVSASLGGLAGLLAAFGFSGLLHELAISVPVEAGFGGPLAYFLLHGLLVALERAPRMSAGLARHPGLARLWTVGALVLPLPWLFHPPFLAAIVWPLLGVSVPLWPIAVVW
jgi:alginate O-acetyltransferase complex protein AlgI